MAFLGVWLIVGTICGIIAIAVSRDRDSKWFLAGFLLGPIGIVVALLAPRRFETPSGMRAVTCPRCSAQQNVPTDDTSYECWQCKLVSSTPRSV